MGGQISISENVTQNKIVYPNISKITGAFLIPQLTFTDVSWSYKTDDGDDDDDGFRNGDNYGNNVYNYENIVKASYLIPEKAVNIKLSLKAIYNNDGAISRNFDNIQSVIQKIPEISGNLDILNIDNIKDNIINAKPNIQIPGTTKNDIKWTIKGTDVSDSFTFSEILDNSFTFTNDNVKRWKEIIENINKYDKKALKDDVPQIKLSLIAGDNDNNKFKYFQKVYTTQFVELSGSICQGHTISPHILNADRFFFTNVQYEIFDSLNKLITVDGAGKSYGAEIYDSATINNASFKIPNASIFTESMKNWSTNRPTIKLTIQIFNKTHDISRTLTVTDNISLKWDTELTSNNSFLDISGVIKLDNITQQYIIKQSNTPRSDNLSSFFNDVNLDNVFYGTHPTTLLTNDCSINYKEFNNIVKPDGINLDYDVDPIWARQNLSNVVLQGGLNPKVLLSNNQEILNSAKKYLDIFKGLPYIFNLGHGLLPETDPDKVSKLVKFYKEY